MVKLASIFILLSSFSVLGQPKHGELQAYYVPVRSMELYRVPGLLAASATFTPSTMLNRNATNYYLSGFAEYHLDRKVSLRSDNFYFLNSPAKNSFVDNAFRTYFGGFYHLNQGFFGNWDVKLGFQPGIVFMRVNEFSNDNVSTSRTISSPSFATTIGFDYYVWKYFHFFAHIAYVNSKIGGIESGPQKSDEIFFSAGLGFQIKTLKN